LRQWRLRAAPVGFDAIDPYLAATMVAIELEGRVQFLERALRLTRLEERFSPIMKRLGFFTRK
jgi:hypothetical protein